MTTRSSTAVSSWSAKTKDGSVWSWIVLMTASRSKTWSAMSLFLRVSRRASDKWATILPLLCTNTLSIRWPWWRQILRRAYSKKVPWPGQLSCLSWTRKLGQLIQEIPSKNSLDKAVISTRDNVVKSNQRSNKSLVFRYMITRNTIFARPIRASLSSQL